MVTVNVEEWHREAGILLEGRPGIDVGAVLSAMIEDDRLMLSFLEYLRTGVADPRVRGSFSTWPCSEGMPNPSLGELMAEGMQPIQAFLHLAALAGEVNGRIEELVGRYERCELMCEFGSVW